MTLTADNVRVAVTGTVEAAPLGTTLPTTAESTTDAAFVDQGYVSEDGITQTINTDITDIKAWQNGDIVRKVQTGHDVMYALTLIETSEASLETYYGNYAAGVVEVTGEQMPHRSWALTVVDGEQIIRVVIPDGQITERGEVVYANGDPIGYSITITAFPDTEGVKAYIYGDPSSTSS